MSDHEPTDEEIDIARKGRASMSDEVCNVCGGLGCPYRGVPPVEFSLLDELRHECNVAPLDAEHGRVEQAEERLRRALQAIGHHRKREAECRRCGGDEFLQPCSRCGEGDRRRSYEPRTLYEALLSRAIDEGGPVEFRKRERPNSSRPEWRAYWRNQDLWSFGNEDPLSALMALVGQHEHASDTAGAARSIDTAAERVAPPPPTHDTPVHVGEGRVAVKPKVFESVEPATLPREWRQLLEQRTGEKLDVHVCDTLEHLIRRAQIEVLWDVLARTDHVARVLEQAAVAGAAAACDSLADQEEESARPNPERTAAFEYAAEVIRSMRGGDIFAEIKRQLDPTEDQ